MYSRQTKFLTQIKARFSLENSAYSKNYRRLVFSRRLAELIISSALIFMGQQFVTDNAFFAAIWPATGVGLSALFLRGHFLLCGIFLGSFLSYLHNHFPLPFCLTQSLLFTFYLYLVRVLSLKWIGPITPLAENSTFFHFLFLLSILTLLPIAGLFLELSLRFRAFEVTWFHLVAAWLGHLNGILCLTPLCLVLDPFTPKRYFKTWQSWQAFTIFILLCHFAYYLPLPFSFMLGLAPLLFLILLVFAYRFGEVPTCVTLLGISVIYLGGVLPFPHLFHNGVSPVEMLWLLAWFTLSAVGSIALAVKKHQD